MGKSRVDRVASELVVPTVNLIRLGREKQATLEVREPFSFVLMVRAQRRRNFGRPCEQIVEEAAAQVENLLFNKPSRQYVGRVEFVGGRGSHRTCPYLAIRLVITSEPLS
jgi:hypothetical protein